MSAALHPSSVGIVFPSYGAIVLVDPVRNRQADRYCGHEGHASACSRFTVILLTQRDENETVPVPQ
jgi:hypothetical protein